MAVVGPRRPRRAVLCRYGPYKAVHVGGLLETGFLEQVASSRTPTELKSLAYVADSDLYKTYSLLTGT